MYSSRVGASVLGVEEVPHADTDKYGIVEVDTDDSSISRVRSIVEKPKPAAAPSNLAVVGRYVLTPAIFDHLAQIGRGAGGEIQLTDGIARLMGEEAIYAYRFEGKRFDCGSKLGYLQATVEFALAHPQVADGFRDYLKALDRLCARHHAHRHGKARRERPARDGGSRLTRSGSAQEQVERCFAGLGHAAGEIERPEAGIERNEKRACDSVVIGVQGVEALPHPRGFN